MSFIVVDTDVISYVLKGDTRAERYRPHLDGKTLVVSFMTVAELERWAAENHWGTVRLDEMRSYLEKCVIHPPDFETCRIWADINRNAMRSGIGISCADAWIAATAIQHDIPLVSHNRKDMARIAGLNLISEPDAAS